MLAQVIDRLGEVLAATIAAAGQNPPNVELVSRPRTAIDRARQAAQYARHLENVALLLPAGTTTEEG